MRTIEISLDGEKVSLPEGSTILDGCRKAGVATPTLCFLETLTPVNACRVCVVEVTGSRVLVPACSRKVEAGMEIQTDSERVRHSRKMVLEFLGSSVDLSTAPAVAGYVERYGADPARYGPSAEPAAAGERDAVRPTAGYGRRRIGFEPTGNRCSSGERFSIPNHRCSDCAPSDRLAGLG